jgi:hypothetical protein
MKRFHKLFLTATMILVMAATAQAQVASTNIDTGAGATAGVEVTLTGIVQSSLQLYVNGTFTSAVDGAPNTGADGTAEVNFGTFNAYTNATTTPQAQGDGMLKRTTAGDGMIAYSDLDVWVLVGGGTAATSVVLSLTSETAGTDTRYASGVANAWGNMGEGTEVSAGAITICSGATPCTSGTHFPHQLAVDIPDTFSGTFTNVVRYDATL